MPNYDSPAGRPAGSVRNEDSLLLGRRLGLTPDLGLPRLKLAFSDEDITIPSSGNHISGVPAWNLGGNDRFGTCGPTSVANYITMAYWGLLQQDVTVTDDAIFALYRAAGNPDFDPTTGADDNGVDMITLLKAATDVGLEVTSQGGSTAVIKPIAFGQLPDDINAIRIATAIFGGVILGFSLDTAQQAQTSQGFWDYVPSGSWGGHAVMGASYTSDLGGPDESVISWAEPIGMTDSFVSHQLTQAFAVILPIHLAHKPFLDGVDLKALAADYQELTGNTFPSV